MATELSAKVYSIWLAIKLNHQPIGINRGKFGHRIDFPEPFWSGADSHFLALAVYLKLLGSLLDEIFVDCGNDCRYWRP